MTDFQFFSLMDSAINLQQDTLYFPSHLTHTVWNTVQKGQNNSKTLTYLLLLSYLLLLLIKSTGAWPDWHHATGSRRSVYMHGDINSVMLWCVWLDYSVETAAVRATVRRRTATKSTVAVVKSQLLITLLHPLEAFTPHTNPLAANISVQVGDTWTLGTLSWELCTVTPQWTRITR